MQLVLGRADLQNGGDGAGRSDGGCLNTADGDDFAPDDGAAFADEQHRAAGEHMAADGLTADDDIRAAGVHDDGAAAGDLEGRLHIAADLDATTFGVHVSGLRSDVGLDHHHVEHRQHAGVEQRLAVA